LLDRAVAEALRLRHGQVRRRRQRRDLHRGQLRGDEEVTFCVAATRHRARGVSSVARTFLSVLRPGRNARPTYHPRVPPRVAATREATHAGPNLDPPGAGRRGGGRRPGAAAVRLAVAGAAPRECVRRLGTGRGGGVLPRLPDAGVVAALAARRG